MAVWDRQPSFFIHFPLFTTETHILSYHSPLFVKNNLSLIFIIEEMEKDKKIELKIQEITSTQTPAHAYAMLLTEVNGNRQVPVIIGANEAQSILLCMKGLKPPRPLTHDLFMTCLTALDTQLIRVLIYAVKDGVFYAHLYLKNEESIICVDARTSDAVSLAIRMGAPILMYESILEKEKIRTTDEKEENPDETKQHSNRAPWEYWNEEKLQRDMENAIEEENYELAAKLRDEINKRK